MKAQPKNSDLLKVLGYIVALFVFLCVPFMAGWIDKLFNFIK